MDRSVLIILLGAVAIASLLLFFRTSPGELLINRLKPKPDLTNPNNWTIGPVVNGANASLNMPLHPEPGFVLNLPEPSCQPHYVTVNYGALTGKKRITMSGRVEGGPLFAKDGVSRATLCLYFQRRFDDWEATQGTTDKWESNQNTQYYRWFATASSIMLLADDTFTVTANFSDNWTALQADSLDSKTGEGASYFKDAMAAAGEVGFVLGGGDGWGHGIMSPTPARIIVTSFQVDDSDV